MSTETRETEAQKIETRKLLLPVIVIGIFAVLFIAGTYAQIEMNRRAAEEAAAVEEALPGKYVVEESTELFEAGDYFELMENGTAEVGIGEWRDSPVEGEWWHDGTWVEIDFTAPNGTECYLGGEIDMEEGAIIIYEGAIGEEEFEDVEITWAKVET